VTLILHPAFVLQSKIAAVYRFLAPQCSDSYVLSQENQYLGKLFLISDFKEGYKISLSGVL
jgi:hypothetical protein